MQEAFRIDPATSGRNSSSLSGIKAQWQADGHGNLLAIAYNSQNNSNEKPCLIQVLGRGGACIKEFSYDCICVALEWSREDPLLAIVLESGKIVIWNSSSDKEQIIDSTWKGITVAKWAPKGQILALGTSKGNLLIINKAIGKKIPILGKHSKGITTMEWFSDNTLALASEDKTFTINSSTGDLILQNALNADPLFMKVYERTVPNPKEQRVLLIVLGNKTLFLYTPDQPAGSNSMEIPVSTKNGSIVSCEWNGADEIIVAFASGMISVVSTALNPGKEILNIKENNERYLNASLHAAANKYVTLSDKGIKSRYMNDLKTIDSIISISQDSVNMVEPVWSHDGQYLLILFKKGISYVFLTKMPLVISTFESTVAYLASMSQIILFDSSKIGHSTRTAVQSVNEQSLLSINTSIEVEMIALSHNYVAVGSHNQVEIHEYNLISNTTKHVSSFKVSGFLQTVGLSHSIAFTMVDGTVFFRMVEDGEERSLPIANVKISYLRAFSNFLVGYNSHEIFHILPQEGLIAATTKHEEEIIGIYPDPAGVLIAYVDMKQKVHIYDPVSETIFPVTLDTSDKIQNVIWDYNPNTGMTIIGVYDGNKLDIFRIFSATLNKMKFTPLCQVTFANTGYYPVNINQGTVFCLTKNRQLIQFLVESYSIPSDESEDMLMKHYYAGCFKENWFHLAQRGISANVWQNIGRNILLTLDIETATLIYRHIGDIAVVAELEDCLFCGNKNFVCGKISMILDEVDMAQEFFLASDRPEEALFMRQDLQQWDQALILASKISPNQIPYISLEYASQLEENEKYKDAWKYYKDSLQNIRQEEAETYDRAQAGFIRCCLKLGDISTAMKLMINIKNPQYLVDCACILESLKQNHEAALLFEKGGSYEKAAELYARGTIIIEIYTSFPAHDALIIVKNYGKVGELLTQVDSPKLHVLYAKYKESTGDLQGALKSYQIAKDLENTCRMYIELKQIDTAVKIARESKSVNAAKVVLKFFQQMQDHKAMIEFCLLAGSDEQAFSIAQSHSLMGFYAEMIESRANDDTISNLASYFEQQDQGELAVKYLIKSGQYDKALDILLKQPRTEETMKHAVQLASMGKSKEITEKVLEYLSKGATDAQVGKHLMKLYLSIGLVDEAAETGIFLAKSEQDAGNYKQSKTMMLQLIQDLKRIGKEKVPYTIYERLAIVQSYLLIKTLVKLDEHETASRLLIRIFKNIESFPLHVVPILTTGVIECHRAGLKKSAFGMAAILCKSEYRNQIDEKFRKKIELSVRRPETQEADEGLSPCPHCKSDIPNSELVCGNCKNRLPFCIASGMHITRGSWTKCPHCLMPANLDKFKAAVGLLQACPLCETLIDSNSLSLMKNLQDEEQNEFLNALI